MKHKFYKPLKLINVIFVLVVLILPVHKPGGNSAPVLAADQATGVPINHKNLILPLGFDGKKSGSSGDIYLPLVLNPNNTWSMAAANPQRTSWIPEEVRGKLYPAWYRPIEPYILPRVQVISAYNTLYISTSAGLYALDASSGKQKWVYPTDMPLGHSPSIINGVAYVGGFDQKIHAINAHTGKPLWTFKAGAGFDTNPLVVDGTLYAGNRDGYFYAIYTEGTNQGKLAWNYKTGGPIHYSAAYKNGNVYFASNDNRAYALDSQTGKLVWRSGELPGAGFHSWWPVVYGDWVIFAGTEAYRSRSQPGPDSGLRLQWDGVFPNRDRDPKGTLVGPLGQVKGNWSAGTPTINASKPESTSNGKTKPITQYLEEKPWRRTYFVLNRFTGKEYTSDFDSDGRPEYAPILWFGVKGGTIFPPVVGNDGVLYQPNLYMSDQYIPGGHISGWQFGTPNISVITQDWGAGDEPHAYSSGGSLIYWSLCCDRQIGAIDISIPNTKFADRYKDGIRPSTGGGFGEREWLYANYNLPDLVPGYNQMTYVWDPYPHPLGGVYGGRIGSYGWHGDTSPPIPYKGKVYTINSNAVIAFSPSRGQAVALPLARTVADNSPSKPAPDTDHLKQLLVTEVEKIIAAGHLRPGYVSSGLLDHWSRQCSDEPLEYWHHPSDILYTLLRALPHLPPGLRSRTKDYIQAEFAAYPPYKYNHIGWRDGVTREYFKLPPEVQQDLVNYPPKTGNNLFSGWNFAPHSFYVLWKYAQEFGNAKTIFDLSKNKLEPVPQDSLLIEMPHVHNAYIAGYLGYLKLEKLAGYPQSIGIKNELNRLLILRDNTFSKDPPDSYFTEKPKYYCRSFNGSRNFMYLVPELAQYLHDNSYDKVRHAVEKYEDIAPYWFVSRAEVVFGEGTINHLYDVQAIFHAKAWILDQPREELARYLDVPAVKVGDLFYIDNLISTIEAKSSN